jgi:hypothetical protein
MGSSAKATICCGIILEDNREYPWSNDEDIESWWLEKICKYVPPFKIFDENGNYLNKVIPTPKQLEEYFDHKRDFKNKNPLPVKIIYSGSDNDLEKILSVLDTEQWTSWESPIKISIVLLNSEKLYLFKRFCKTYLNIDDVEPKWLLSAFYG